MPDLRLPSQPGQYQIILLGEQRHIVCEQLAQSRYMKWIGRDSNLWPLDCKSYALTTTPHVLSLCIARRCKNIVIIQRNCASAEVIVPHPVRVQTVWSCSTQRNTDKFRCDQRCRDCTQSSSLSPAVIYIHTGSKRSGSSIMTLHCQQIHKVGNSYYNKSSKHNQINLFKTMLHLLSQAFIRRSWYSVLPVLDTERTEYQLLLMKASDRGWSIILNQLIWWLIVITVSNLMNLLTMQCQYCQRREDTVSRKRSSNPTALSTKFFDPRSPSVVW